jgi:hypothetical protein
MHKALRFAELNMSVRSIAVTFGIFWQLFSLSRAGISHMKYLNVKAINWGLPLAGHKLNATPIATTKKTNHIQCMVECAKTEGCVAINHGPSQNGEKECELLDVARYSLKNPIIASPGWTYVGPKV